MNKLPGLIACAIVLSLCPPNTVSGQSKGPVISEFGDVWKIDGADIPGDDNRQLHAVFDVYDSAMTEAGINRQLETAARYLNLHAQNGVPLENLKVALVVHGTATEDLLDTEFHMARHGIPNANADLVAALLHAWGAAYGTTSG